MGVLREQSGKIDVIISLADTGNYGRRTISSISVVGKYFEYFWERTLVISRGVHCQRGGDDSMLQIDIRKRGLSHDLSCMESFCSVVNL